MHCCAGSTAKLRSHISHSALSVILAQNLTLQLAPAARWSALSRNERYKTRCGADGVAAVDASNPLPERFDPITLEPVVSPAISPYGHVMGAATWKVRPAPTPSNSRVHVYACLKDPYAMAQRAAHCQGRLLITAASCRIQRRLTYVHTCIPQAVLAEKGKCPFTGQPLAWHQCTMLTHANIQRFRDRIRD